LESGGSFLRELESGDKLCKWTGKWGGGQTSGYDGKVEGQAFKTDKQKHKRPFRFKHSLLPLALLKMFGCHSKHFAHKCKTLFLKVWGHIPHLHMSINKCISVFKAFNRVYMIFYI